MYNTVLRPDSKYFLFFFFLAVIAGVAFGFADTYQHMSNVDVQTYTGLFDFDLNQHPVRRYRIIVPLLASIFHLAFGPLLEIFAPNEFPGNFPMIMSFVAVNSSLMAIYAVLLFKLCTEVLGKDAYWPSMIGVLSVLTCRWTAYLAGSALVDSLFLVTIALLCLGLIRKHLWLVLVAIYLGPWAKESFIFFVPLLIFIERKHYLKIAIHLILSGIIVFSYRYGFDSLIGVSMTESLDRDIAHFEGISASLRRLFSFHGLYEILSIGGVWNFFLFIGISINESRKELAKQMTPFWMVFIAIIIFQALLSQELARMFYMLTPLLAIMVAVVFRYFYSNRSLMNVSAEI